MKAKTGIIKKMFLKQDRLYNLIFLVDDNLTYLKILKADLSDLPKCKIMYFTTGEECLKYMHLQPNVVVLDYELSEGNTEVMNGIDVLIEIKKSNPDTEVIMLSGWDDIKVATSSIKFGAFDFVVKNQNALINLRNRIKNSFRKIRMLNEIRASKIVKWQIAAIVTVVVAWTFLADKVVDIL